MTATEDTRNQATAAIHCAIDRLLGEAARQLHAAVQADVNAQARVVDLEAVIERLRKEIERLTGALRIEAEQADGLLREVDDLRAANHNYARLLTDVRAALDAEEDADLPEAARALVAETENRRTALVQCSEERRVEWTRAERAEADVQASRGDLSAAERALLNTREVLSRVDSILNEGDRTEPTILGSQAARVVARLERAEAECGRLRTGIALVRAYKAAVDGLNGVADAEAALFAWLEEVDHADYK